MLINLWNQCIYHRLLNPLSHCFWTGLLESRVLRNGAWFAALLVTLLGVQDFKTVKFPGRDISSLAVKGLSTSTGPFNFNYLPYSYVLLEKLRKNLIIDLPNQKEEDVWYFYLLRIHNDVISCMLNGCCMIYTNCLEAEMDHIKTFGINLVYCRMIL